MMFIRGCPIGFALGIPSIIGEMKLGQFDLQLVFIYLLFVYI